jgi:hypothetical protein
MFYLNNMRNSHNVILFIITGFLIILSMHFAMEAGLTCVDKNGCVRISCQEIQSDLNQNYQTLIAYNKGYC